MALQLSALREAYKEFYGRTVDMMPVLIGEGLSPMSFAQVMQRRLDVLGGDKAVEDAWWMMRFDTSDVIAYHRDGKIKILLDSQIVRELNPESNLKNGALALPDDLYEKLQGDEFTKGDVEKYAQGNNLTQNEVLYNPFWKALARDPELHKEYVRAVFREAKQRYDLEKLMSVSFSHFREGHNLRLCTLSGLYEGSYAYGRGALDSSDGRLVGTVLEGVQKKATLENRVGGLQYSVPLFERTCESAELMNERRSDSTLRDKTFWTANFALYRVENGEAILYFGGRENNPIFNNIEEAAAQFRKELMYIPKKRDVKAIVNSNAVLRVSLSDLGLTVVDWESAYLEISTMYYDRTLNQTGRAFAERIYGQGDDFVENMRMLARNRIPITRVHVFNPEYVKNNVKKKLFIRTVPPIARVCRLSTFSDNSDFYADVWYVYNSNLSLRGIPKVD